MFSLCKVSGKISTIPSTPGLVVWNKGHIGISIDGVYAIEERGFNYGIQKTKIRNRSWTHWGQFPASMLEYVTETVAAPETAAPDGEQVCPYVEPAKNQKNGSKGEGVQWCQWMLEACGYSVGSYGIDGDFGSATRSAVRKFQKAYGLSADGIVGPLTRNKLKAVLAAKN